MDSLTTTISDKNVSYFDTKQGKKILLLVPGFSFKTGFIPLIHVLKKDFRVISPDIPGFGLSEYNPDVMSLEKTADFLAEFMHQLKVDKVSLFGNSMGATVCLMFAYKYPKFIDKLIIRSPLFTKKQLRFPLFNKSVVNLLERLSEIKFIGKILLLVFLKQFDNLSAKNNYNSKLLEEIKKQQKENLNFSAAKNVLLDLARIDLTDLLPRIHSKTLILWGENDEVLSVKWATSLNELLPYSNLFIEKSSTHNIVTQNEKRLSKNMVEFLD